MGIHPDVICHRLNIDLDKKPVRQKKKVMDLERYNGFKKEVDKLLKINFIREAHYPMLLTNPVLVKKLNGKWRTCIDYNDLNKACPKDSPAIANRLVDKYDNRHELLSFMDAYSGYNQITMYDLDQEHMSFITDRVCTTTK